MATTEGLAETTYIKVKNSTLHFCFPALWGQHIDEIRKTMKRRQFRPEGRWNSLTLHREISSIANFDRSFPDKAILNDTNTNTG